MGVYLDSNEAFSEWCAANGYDEYTEYDREEEVHKRSALVGWYIRKDADDTYAQVSANQDYDLGRDGIQIEREGLKRIEKEVTTTVVVYE